MVELPDGYYRAIEWRIEWLTLFVSGCGAVYAFLRWGWRAGLGVLVGGVLSWQNFRWLVRSISALLSVAAAQAVNGSVHISRGIYGRFLGRVVLIVFVLYAILRNPWLPGRAILAGFLSLTAAVLVEVGYELFVSLFGPNPQ